MSMPRSPRESQSESATAPAQGEERIARRLRLGGHVQGVGFRPFVYRLAGELALDGSVQNLHGEVEILVSGFRAAVERFVREVIGRAPPLARPRLMALQEAPPVSGPGFVILESAARGATRVFVPPDSFTCEDCLAELSDPASRRFRYPFINCTQCGPRYTLIEALPYDRPNTTMAGFPLCARCRAEYEDPADRRFHAEPVACVECGPTVWLETGPRADQGQHPAGTAAAAVPAEALRGEQALRRAVEVLRAGKILAVKGIGGYHLLCDATCADAVARLRERKGRPDKPLAVVFPQCGADGLESIRREVELTETQACLLVSAARPIVLTRRRAGSALTPRVAPGLAEVGVFLPYSPLHHLLLADAGRPLVATSGNLSGEPVMTTVDSARRHLARVADASLHHDRPIARPADDPVMRCLLGRPRAVRLGRGVAPLELALPWRLARPVLATGGHLKTTVALAWEDRVVVSPHIADMGTVRSVAVFAQVAEDLQRLYGVRAAEVVCDAHPDFATSRWALASDLPVTRVLHHHAHASAVAGEHPAADRMLVFAWDGTGLGEDGSLWGGESFLGTAGHWRRVASLRPFRLPGGELAARAPWRCAAGVCWEMGLSPPGPPPAPLVRQAWARRVNAPLTSSAGRLFDAAAALVLGLRETSYEGQAPLMLEAAAGELDPEPSRASRGTQLTLRRDGAGLLQLDWQPLFASLLRRGRGTAERAAEFHAAMAGAILSVAERLRDTEAVTTVALAGGVFQNARLTTLAHEALSAQGFRVCLAERIPCNDGGLSYGQIIERAARAGCVR